MSRWDRWTREPVLHTFVTDVLPDDHPLAWETVYCIEHGGMVHHCINENMQPWAETEDGPMCLHCLADDLYG